MKLLKAKRILALGSAALLLAGLFCMPVSAETPPFNDTTLDWGGLCPKHVYDNDCDPDCNTCSALREVSDHVYDNACDADCNVCGNTRQVRHAYDNACDEVCNVCGNQRVITHDYRSVVTPPTCENGGYTTHTCSVCGDTYLDNKTEITDHEYSAACDATCNFCGATREAYHTLIGATCTTPSYCADCGSTFEEALGHSYDDDLDVYCDVCGAYRIVVVTQPKTTYGKEGATVKIPVSAVGEGLTYTWYIKNAGASKYSKSSVTTATYSVKISDASHGRSVYCVITDAYGNEATTATVLVRRQASITTDLATAAYAKKGAKVTVKVTAKGDGLTYTWYIKNSGASKYSKSSVTAASYSATMSSSVKNRSVYCIVKDKYGKTVQTKTAVLRESVSITKEPATTIYAKKNATAKVSVTASGDGLTYTWYVKNNGASKYTKASVKTATYSVKMTAAVKGRRVYCIVKDKYGKTVQSKTVLLRESVSIVTQPKTVTVKKNATAKVTVKASGDGLTYTWYYKNASAKKFTKVSGSKTYYSVKMTAAVKNRKVYCVVKDKYGKTVQTSTVTLKMK